MAEDTQAGTIKGVTEHRDAIQKAPRPKRDKGREVIAKKASRLSTLVVTYVPVGDIKPNLWNPNRQSDHDFELLCRSMEEDGFTQTIVAIKVTAEHKKDAAFATFAGGDAVIVDGEHRWRAAMKLGFTEIPDRDSVPS